jgi:hypothetical protein
MLLFMFMLSKGISNFTSPTENPGPCSATQVSSGQLLHFIISKKKKWKWGV